MFRQFLYAFVIVIFSVASLFATDWGTFRGPDGSGKSPDTGLLKEWPEGGPKLLWTADFIGYGYSNVSITGDRMFITGNVERNGETLSMVFCLDKDGNKIWESDNGPAHTDARQYPGTRGTPAIDSGFVYDVSPLGEIACFDAQTGEKIWSQNPKEEYDTPTEPWLYGHSLIIEGDKVIYPLGGPKHIAIALDKKTGKTVWEAAPVANPPGVVLGSTTPYAFDFEGTRVVTVLSIATVEGLDARTGKTLFSIPFLNNSRTNCNMPIYHDGHLFLTTGYGFGAKLFKLAKNSDGTITPTEVWSERRFDNQHHGVVMVDDYVYGATYNGSWGSIHFMTGEIGYLHRGFGKISVFFADGLLYGLTDDDKTVLLLKPEPKEFVLLSQFELPNEVEGPSWAHPVVFGGRLYLRHGEYLYCYDVRSL